RRQSKWARDWSSDVWSSGLDVTALTSVEVAQVDRFGQLGKWTVGKNGLAVARSGHAVVRQGSYLYAIGGTSTKAGTGGLTPGGETGRASWRERRMDRGVAGR